MFKDTQSMAALDVGSESTSLPGPRFPGLIAQELCVMNVRNITSYAHSFTNVSNDSCKYSLNGSVFEKDTKAGLTFLFDWMTQFCKIPDYRMYSTSLLEHAAQGCASLRLLFYTGISSAVAIDSFGYGLTLSVLLRAGIFHFSSQRKSLTHS